MNFVIIIVFLCFLSICVTTHQSDMKQMQNIFFNTTINEARKKQTDDTLSRILPMMVMPFMTSLMFLPMMLISMKFMLLQSMILGKLAIFMAALTILRSMVKNGGGLFTHNVNANAPGGKHHHQDLSKYNYGYSQ